jgi:hypothetical protein
MRGAFGLVGLLVCVGIVVWVWSQKGAHPADTAKELQKAQDRIEEFDPAAAMKSATLAPKEVNGKIVGIEVTKIDPSGAMAKKYGLQKGDIIISAGPLDVKESDGDKLVLEAYRTQAPLVVQRGSEKLTLTPAQLTSPGSGSSGSSGGSSALDRQLDGIRRPQQIPTH